MIRVSDRRAAPSNEAGLSDRSWARRTDLPLGMILAWAAALVVTTEGLMAWQNFFG
jgi:hypothetical protein